MSLMRVFEQYGPVSIPWTDTNFPCAITHGVGVWATRENKMSSLQLCYQCYFDGRIAYAKELCVADRTAFAPRARAQDGESLIELLGTQLRAMKDQKDGTVSGKDLGCDDLACALLLGIYWSMCARAVYGGMGVND
jgi:hypothetical protein